MPLFSEGPGTSSERFDASQSFFEWINQSNRVQVCRGRTTLNAWLSSAPAPLRDHVASQVVIGTNEFHSAIFELYTYELITKMGYSVVYSPTTGTSRPDFLILENETPKYYLECTANFGVNRISSKQAAIDRLLDNMRKRLSIIGRTINVRRVVTSNANPSPVRLSRKLQAWIDNPSSLAGSILENDEEYWIIDHSSDQIHAKIDDPSSGWALYVSLMPLRDTEQRPADPFGSISSGDVEYIPSNALRNEIKHKLEQHSDIDLPLLVAVSFQDFLSQPDTDDDILESLLGTARYGFDPANFQSGEIVRARDGVWTRSQSRARESCPGIIVSLGCFLWSLERMDPVLWVSPNNHPNDVLDRWPLTRRGWNSNGEPLTIKGRVGGDLLQLNA